LDADGINCIADNIDIIKNTKNKLIITPHAGELGHLLGISAEEAVADRFSAAVKLSSIYKIVVVAKGVPTFVVGDGKAYLCRTGNPGLSRGGSGDVLTGIIAGFVHREYLLLKRLLQECWFMGICADRLKDKTSMLGMLPSDIINELPYVFEN
jgi:NAD(P)H-hydrate epimerase